MVLGLPPCILCQLPHIGLAVCLIASAVKSLRWNRHAQILFHAMAGAILLLVPELLHGPMISNGAFDQVQTYLQRSTAPFHLGFAIYHFCNSFMDRSKAAKNPLILFAKALVAYLLLLNNLASAYLLYEQRVRGQHPSQNFLGCTLMVYGVWLGTELYSLFDYTGNPYTDEIELKWLSTRTRRWAEAGSTGIGIERVLFWLDSLICFVGAMFYFAFSEQFLKIMTRREHPIGPLHEMYSLRSCAPKELLGLPSHEPVSAISAELLGTFWAGLVCGNPHSPFPPQFLPLRPSLRTGFAHLLRGESRGSQRKFCEHGHGDPSLADANSTKDKMRRKKKGDG